MNNCLVKKLKEAVNNSNLIHFNSILLERTGITSERTAVLTRIGFINQDSKIIVNSGHIYTDSAMTNEVSEAYPDSNNYISFYTPSDENCTIKIEGKYNLYIFGGDDKWKINIEELYYCVYLKDLKFSRLTIENAINLENLIENNVGSVYIRETPMTVFIPGGGYDKVLFNGTVLSSSNKYVFTEDNIVYVYAKYINNTYSSLLGTYNKITKEWSYT